MEVILVSAYFIVAAIVFASLLSQSIRRNELKSNSLRIADGAVCLFVGIIWLPVIIFGVLVWFDREVMS